MEMIRHQAPGKYIASVCNMFLAKRDKMNIVTITEKDRFLVIASVVDMI